MPTCGTGRQDLSGVQEGLERLLSLDFNNCGTVAVLEIYIALEAGLCATS